MITDNEENNPREFQIDEGDLRAERDEYERDVVPRCQECDEKLDDEKFYIGVGERVCRDCYNEWLRENER